MYLQSSFWAWLEPDFAFGVSCCLCTYRATIFKELHVCTCNPNKHTYHVWADPLEGITVSDLHRENDLIWGKNRIPVIGPLHAPVPYDGISHAEMQVVHSGTFLKQKAKSS